jgi:hypothetical protein
VPSISSFNINDVALYYHALRALSDEPREPAAAAEHVRERLVAYLERRRAVLSLPPLRTEMTSIGKKAISELRSMGLCALEDGKVQLLEPGRDVVSQLVSGNAKLARRAVLGQMIETFDNVYGLVCTLSASGGKPLHLPAPRSSVSSEESDDATPGTADGTLDLQAFCDAWRAWCLENQRPDLLPDDLLARAQELHERSTDRDVGQRIKNAVQPLVLEKATGGVVSKVAIFRTIRDRLETAGAVNSRVRLLEGSTIGLETAYSCLHIGAVPPGNPSAFIRLAVPRSPAPIFVHEPEPTALADQLLEELGFASRSLVARAGYYRIYELRDRVCERLLLSQGVFDATFLHVYSSRPQAFSLGVDYETITAKRLPVEIRQNGRSDQFNLVSFRQPTQGGVTNADHPQE